MDDENPYRAPAAITDVIVDAGTAAPPSAYSSQRRAIAVFCSLTEIGVIFTACQTAGFSMQIPRGNFWRLIDADLGMPFWIVFWTACILGPIATALTLIDIVQQVRVRPLRSTLLIVAVLFFQAIVIPWCWWFEIRRMAKRPPRRLHDEAQSAGTRE